MSSKFIRYLNPYNYHLADLTGLAAFLGLVGGTVALVFLNHKRTAITRQPYFTKAFVTLRQNQPAVQLIGEPIYAKKIDLSDDYHVFSPHEVKVKVPFKGSQKKGDLFIWANRECASEDWTLRKLEIIFNDLRDKKVIVYRNE